MLRSGFHAIKCIHFILSWWWILTNIAVSLITTIETWNITSPPDVLSWLLHSQCLSLPWASNSYRLTFHSTVVFLEFYTNRIIQYMFFDVCILLFGIIFFRIIHVVWKVVVHSLLLLHTISLYEYSIVYLFTSVELLDCVQFWAVVKKAAVTNIYAQVSVDIWFCVSWINA